MNRWAQAVSERYLSEHMKKNPQAIWDLLPEAGELIEDVDQKIQAGELLASEAEALVRTRTEQAKRDWIVQAGRELIRWIVAFETGQQLDEMVEKIRQGDKKTALLLADTIYPDPETPEYEALTEIRGRYHDQDAFVSALDQALEYAREKEKPEARRQSRGGETLSTGRLMDIFFWVQFNRAWLREEGVDHKTAYEALVDYLGEDEDLPRPESFQRMLQLFGVEGS